MKEYNIENLTKSLYSVVRDMEMRITGTDKYIKFNELKNIRNIMLSTYRIVQESAKANEPKYRVALITFYADTPNNMEIGPYESVDDAIKHGEREHHHVDVVQRYINGVHEFYYRPSEMKIECFCKLNEPMTYEELKHAIIDNNEYSKYMQNGYSLETFISTGIGNYYANRD